MKRYSTLTRAAVAFAAAATALLALAAPATAAPPGQKFYADSGDSCTYGHTEGILAWTTFSPSIYSTVLLEGTLTDEPAPDAPSLCRDDAMFTRATYTAYAGRTIVDTSQARVENGIIPVRDVLGDQVARTVIDRIVVQICRFTNTPIGISYCGPAQTYTRPVIGPA